MGPLLSTKRVENKHEFLGIGWYKAGLLGPVGLWFFSKQNMVLYYGQWSRVMAKCRLGSRSESAGEVISHLVLLRLGLTWGTHEEQTQENSGE
jgi:hypothetical protein